MEGNELIEESKELMSNIIERNEKKKIKEKILKRNERIGREVLGKGGKNERKWIKKKKKRMKCIDIEKLRKKG